MLERADLRFLGACLIRAHRPEYSVGLCLALADDLVRANERGAPFPEQTITRDLGPMPWDAPPIERPRGAEVPA